MEKSAFASSVVSEEEASLRGQSPRVEVGKGRYRSYRHDGGNSGGSRFSRRYVERSGGWIARGSARRGPGGDAPLSSIARCAKIASSSSTWTSFLALPMVLAGSVSRSGSGRGVSDAGRRLGMPFSIRLGNRNPDGNRAPRRVGGGFVEPELDGRGTFGGSRRGTHRARVGGACVRLCGSNAARDARLDSDEASSPPPPKRFLLFPTKNAVLVYAYPVSRNRTTYPNGAQSTFFACRANVSASTSEVPSSTKFHLRNAWWRASHLELRCRRSVGRTRPRARHPRARARGARAGGRPAPVAPVSAVSRRCSCSGSPRSPSRA